MSVDVTELARGVTTRSAVSVARAISLVEDRRPAQEPKILSLLANLAKSPNVAACRRVGITGPPGVGKSSLVSALCRALRAQAAHIPEQLAAGAGCGLDELADLTRRIAALRDRIHSAHP